MIQAVEGGSEPLPQDARGVSDESGKDRRQVA